MMKTETIWIINHYATNQYLDSNGRHHCLAKYFIRKGYKVKIFCANTVHNSEEKIDVEEKGYIEKKGADGVIYCFISSPSYKNNGLQRIHNMFTFYRNVKSVCLEKMHEGEKPAVIIASSVHPLALLAGIQIDKRENIPCICEIRDLWPLSIVAYSKHFTDKNVLIKLLYLGEKWIYKNARALVFLDDGDYEYIVDKGWQKAIPRDKVFFISNGVDLEVFNENKNRYILSDIDLDNSELFKIVYAGSIRKVNNLGSLLDTAKYLRDKRVKILIWGAGDELENLEQRVKSEQITNVVFKGYVDKKYIASITSRADLNIVHNSSSPILKYGISFNKIFDYMAAGKPVLCDFSCDFNPIISSRCGDSISVGTPKQVAEKIEQFANMNNDQYYYYCNNARKAANHYDYKQLAEKYLEVINYTLCKEQKKNG